MDWVMSWFHIPYDVAIEPGLRLRQLFTPAVLALSILPSSPLTPINCLTDPNSVSLEALVSCFDNFVVPEKYYDQVTYGAAQPTSTERNAWAAAIPSLLDADNDCSDQLPPALTGIYTTSLFNETTPGGSQFCVFSESTARAGVYTRGWGLFVVPSAHTAVSRNIHFSAPSPVYETQTSQQAASLFKGTGARSLLISGRARKAFQERTECIVSSKGDGPYYKTDPAYDDNEPFFDATKAIHTWQGANGGCPAASCAFIQMHGKGPTSCPSDNVFMSSGLGNGSSSISWYTDATDRPIKRLKAQLDLVFPAWANSLPSDSACILTATKTIAGRLLNGIDRSRVCTEAANASIATGEFVHLEQDKSARDAGNFEGWIRAIKGAFHTTCAGGGM